MGSEELTHDEPSGELEIEGSDSPCSYLPGQTARMTYRLAYRLTDARYEQLLSRGWRRFGRTLFRPACSACAACQSLRVAIPEFAPSKSQRRVIAKSPQLNDLTVIIQKPSMSTEHLSLYNRYHLDMHHRRQWPFREINRDHYFDSFVDGHFTFAREFQYRFQGKLIGLGLVDVTKSVMSSIYFFHDPDWRDTSLGTYSVMREIEDGREHDRQWLYMGYYIRDCGSMNYKNRYKPHQLLQSYVSDQETPNWMTPLSSDETC